MEGPHLSCHREVVSSPHGLQSQQLYNLNEHEQRDPEGYMFAYMKIYRNEFGLSGMTFRSCNRWGWIDLKLARADQQEEEKDEERA